MRIEKKKKITVRMLLEKVTEARMQAVQVRLAGSTDSTFVSKLIPSMTVSVSGDGPSKGH